MGDAAEKRESETTPRGRVIDLPTYYELADVRKMTGWKERTAYKHMRLAVGRAPGKRGTLRVPMATWQRYVREVLGWEPSESTNAAVSGGAGTTTRRARSSGKALSAATRRVLSHSSESANDPLTIPVIKPRVKPRLRTP